MVDEKSEATYGDDQELHPERVMIAIIGGFELGIDQVHRRIRTSDIDNLLPDKKSKNIKDTDSLYSEAAGNGRAFFNTTYLQLQCNCGFGPRADSAVPQLTFIVVLYSEIKEVRRSK